MPPFGRLAAIVISAEDSAEAETVARRIGNAAPKVEGMAVFGPAPAPLAMLRGRHRQRLLVHAARSLDVQDVIRDWLAGARMGRKVRVSGRRRSLQLPLRSLSFETLVPGAPLVTFGRNRGKNYHAFA